MAALSSKTAARPGTRRTLFIVVLGVAIGLALVAALKLYVWRQDRHFREVAAARAAQSSTQASQAHRRPHSAAARLQQGEQKLRTAGKEGSWKYVQARIQRLPAGKSPERWKTYDLLEYYCNNVADKGTLRFEAKKGMADVLYFEGRLDEWVASALCRSAMTIEQENPADAVARCQRGLALVAADSPMARELSEQRERIKRKFLDDLDKMP